MSRQFNGKRIVFSTNDAGSTGYPNAKERSWTPISHHIRVLTKNVGDQNVRTKTLKILEENIEVNCHELALDSGFLDMIPKAQATKEKRELDFIRI